MTDAVKLKEIACQAIDNVANELNAASQDIWNHPELGFEEKRAHDTLTNFLEKQNFKNIDKSFVLETGFRAVEGEDGPHVSVLCEYDALPEIGHACGHNLIAEVGIGAGVGIKAALDAAKAEGKSLGKLTVFGTPAEEGLGGKVDFINAKCFENIDYALMAHPWGSETFTKMYCLAREKVEVIYKGKASHAAGFPWEGVNALDAAVTAYSSISNLRQQMKPEWRVHGVFTNGGAKPNIIPEEAALLYYIRTATMGDLNILKEKVTACFNAAATATGCTVELKWDPKPYANLISNETLADFYETNATSLGVQFADDKDKIGSTPTGSTDMGNVSYEVPSIHPMYYIGTKAANHTREFTTAAGDPKAQPYTLNQAKALAMTAIDVLCKPELVPKMKEQLQKAKSQMM